MNILFDSDFILALLFSEEPTHSLAIKQYEACDIGSEYIIPLVHFEVMTVCSRKYGLDSCRMLNEFIMRQLKRVDVDALEIHVWEEFFKHDKKRISFIDCANVVVAKKYGWKVASFDAFYPKELRAG